jgi:enoyl-CoA hydratase/carnithine racemase
MPNQPEPMVLVEHQNAVAWITLNRPQAMNAINDELRAQLPDALRAADADPQIRVIVVRGAGERAFCAGADIKEFADAPTPAQFHQSRRQGRHWCDAFDEAKKPLIASIHGYCLGGGLEMALACDIRIAAEDAAFALPEVSRGTLPGAGGTQRLARVVGAGRALDMLLSAERIDAAQALRIGLITRLTTRDQLTEQTRTLAERIAGHAPLAVVFAKEAMRKGAAPEFAAGMQFESDVRALLLATEDRREAGRAFREKRKPKFTGT